MSRVLKIKYDKSAELKQKVLPKIYDITNKPNKVNMFIDGGSCSYHNFDEAGKNINTWPELSHLITFIRQHLNDYADMIKVPKEFEFQSMWANRYPPGSAVIRHNHKRLAGDKYLISSLLYIQMPTNGGNLVIEDEEIKLEEGDLVFFESFRDHWTIPNKSSDDRLILAMEHIATKGDNKCLRS